MNDPTNRRTFLARATGASLALACGTAAASALKPTTPPPIDPSILATVQPTRRTETVSIVVQNPHDEQLYGFVIPVDSLTAPHRVCFGPGWGLSIDPDGRQFEGVPAE